MPDVFHDVPADDLALLDEHAVRLGLSRTEFLRRQVHQEARRTATTVTAADLTRFSSAVADLADGSVMSDAWS